MRRPSPLTDSRLALRLESFLLGRGSALKDPWLALVTALAVLAPGLALADRADASTSSSKRPNIVVVMTDDQDARSMWAMPETRRLLARAGTTFPNAYATYPLCCPSRATFLTGQYAHNHGVLSNVPPAGGYPRLDHTNTLPIWLRRAGYTTAHVGKYMNGYGTPSGRQISRRQAALEVPPGWGRWFSATGREQFRMYNYTLNENGSLVDYGRRGRDYQTDVYARHATRLIRRLASRERPLFLSFAPLAPHGEAGRQAAGGPNPRPAPRHRDAYRRKALPRPPSFNEADVSDKPAHVQGLPRIDRESRLGILRRYRGRLASLGAVDDAVAGMVRALNRAGELDNTLIIFTSDNGFMHGEHRIATGKAWPYEESVRVPLILRGPGLDVPRGAMRSQLAANVDLAPTILEAAGVQAGLETDGISLLPLASDPNVGRSRAVLLHALDPNRPRFAGVRLPGWAYVEHGYGAEELYDMAADRFQLESRHADPAYASRKAALAARLEALRACAGSGCR